MPMHRATRAAQCIALPLALAVATSAYAAAAASEDLPWISPRLSDREVHFAKPRLSGQSQDSAAPDEYGPLPVSLSALLGGDTQEFDSFVVARLPAEHVGALTKAAQDVSVVATVLEPAPLELPWSVTPLGAAGFERVTEAAGIQKRAVTGYYVAYLLSPADGTQLARFGECQLWVARLGQRTLLLRAGSAAEILRCSASQSIGWLDHFFNTDRSSQNLLKAPASEYWLQFATPDVKRSTAVVLPATVEVQESLSGPDGATTLLRVKADLLTFTALIEADSSLVSALAAGVVVPSDERQGQIIAGAHNGVSLTGTGYKSWLTSRSLLTTTNQQIVAVVDLGYDNGIDPGTHHLDLESPDRVHALARPDNGGTVYPDAPDPFGHGTMVAGIIAGDGTLPTGSGSADAQGYLYGLGIAPTSQLFGLKPQPLTSTAAVGLSYSTSRNFPAGNDRALIANNSWNQQSAIPGTFIPINTYDAWAQMLDQRVIDANTGLAGNQPMTMVFSAGNFSGTCNGLLWDTVSAPANAKNVIAVGATENYRPVAQAGAPPLACKPCNGVPPWSGRPVNHDATNVSNIASFSSRGKQFQPSPAAQRAYNTRIKPDLVAPGVRVFSTVTQAASYNPGSSVACTGYFPTSPVTTDHSYGSGTSFAAPVVTGTAALLRQALLNASATSATPSLIKAALIATADDLGGLGNNGTDYRPSPVYGWGRVNLNRLTDATVRWFRNEAAADAFSTTGQTRTFTRTIGAANKPLLLVLAWTDPANQIVAGDATLINDLDLKISTPSGYYYGNFFREALDGAAAENGFSKQYITDIGITPDHVNNVEAIFVPANTFAAGATITITVAAGSIAAGPQRFSVYAYNAQ